MTKLLPFTFVALAVLWRVRVSYAVKSNPPANHDDIYFDDLSKEWDETVFAAEESDNIYIEGGIYQASWSTGKTDSKLNGDENSRKRLPSKSSLLEDIYSWDTKKLLQCIVLLLHNLTEVKNDPLLRSTDDGKIKRERAMNNNQSLSTLKDDKPKMDSTLSKESKETGEDEIEIDDTGISYLSEEENKNVDNDQGRFNDHDNDVSNKNKPSRSNRKPQIGEKFCNETNSDSRSREQINGQQSKGETSKSSTNYNNQLKFDRFKLQEMANEQMLASKFESIGGEFMDDYINNRHQSISENKGYKSDYIETADENKNKKDSKVTLANTQTGKKETKSLNVNTTPFSNDGIRNENEPFDQEQNYGDIKGKEHHFPQIPVNTKDKNGISSSEGTMYGDTISSKLIPTEQKTYPQYSLESPQEEHYFYRELATQNYQNADNAEKVIYSNYPVTNTQKTANLNLPLDSPNKKSFPMAEAPTFSAKEIPYDYNPVDVLSSYYPQNSPYFDQEKTLSSSFQHITNNFNSNIKMLEEPRDQSNTDSELNNPLKDRKSFMMQKQSVYMPIQNHFSEVQILPQTDNTFASTLRSTAGNNKLPPENKNIGTEILPAQTGFDNIELRPSQNKLYDSKKFSRNNFNNAQMSSFVPTGTKKDEVTSYITENIAVMPLSGKSTEISEYPLHVESQNRTASDKSELPKEEDDNDDDDDDDDDDDNYYYDDYYYESYNFDELSFYYDSEYDEESLDLTKLEDDDSDNTTELPETTSLDSNYSTDFQTISEAEIGGNPEPTKGPYNTILEYLYNFSNNSFFAGIADQKNETMQ